MKQSEPSSAVTTPVDVSGSGGAKLLVLQHIACEPPAAYEDELNEREIAFDRIRLDEGDPLPDWRNYAGIIAMGGPMGAYDDPAHVWLRDEKRLIRDAVEAGIAYWGVCLGAQLLAASLGASVFRATTPEVGVLAVDLTPEAAQDPVFSDAPMRFPALQWHNDTYELPEGARRLASSDLYREQAFVYRSAYGLQFHVEVPPELAAEWAEVPAYRESLERLMGPGGLPRLVGEIEQHAGMTIAFARHLLARWLEQVVRV